MIRLAGGALVQERLAAAERSVHDSSLPMQKAAITCEVRD